MDHMQLSNGSIQWNVPFIRAVQDSLGSYLLLAGVWE